MSAHGLDVSSWAETLLRLPTKKWGKKILVTMNINCQTDNFQNRSAADQLAPGSPEGTFTKTQSFGDPTRTGAPRALALSSAGQSPAHSSKEKRIRFFSTSMVCHQEKLLGCRISPFVSDQEMGGTCPVSEEEGASSGPEPSPKANLPPSSLRTKAWASPALNLWIIIIHSTGYDVFLLERGEQ